MANSPGRSHREGISLIELAEMFPNEGAATEWFEKWHWPDGDQMALVVAGMVGRRLLYRDLIADEPEQLAA